MSQYKAFIATFLAILLAEMGDKTQLTIMLLSTQHRGKSGVWLGAICALATTSLLAVLLGETLLQFIPTLWIKRSAGLVFLILGINYLWNPT